MGSTISVHIKFDIRNDPAFGVGGFILFRVCSSYIYRIMKMLRARERESDIVGGKVKIVKTQYI